jgi:hypothetical protein
MSWLGFVASLLIWALLACASLQGALYLYRARALGEKWLLLLPFLFASLLFYGARYRFPQWFFSFDTIHQFFAFGAYWEGDRIVFFLCLPFFYAISVLRPDWVVRFWVNVPLLVLFPFALKLFLHFTGIAPWIDIPGALQSGAA